ncbi:MAG: methionyl-tRNA formyltransferase [Desulfovibrionaceae bacterium]
MNPFNVVFMGTPDFAEVVLQALLDCPAARVAAVYTQPDRPCGRGRKCKPSPVKTLALEHGLEIRQPATLRKPEEVEALAALAPDILAVAAYGLILPQSVLDVPKIAPLNVHASLLPKYRGAAPIQRAIQNGESVTGISIMRMEAGLDTGPVLLQRALGIAPGDHAGVIHDELAALGGELLCETLTRLSQGKLEEVEQDHSRATYAAKLSKEEGLIDWSRPASEVHNHIRAMHPWPGAFYTWEAEPVGPVRLTVFPGKKGAPLDSPAKPGTIIGLEKDFLAIACGQGTYLTPMVKPEGRKAMNPQQFYCGYLHRCAGFECEDACREESDRT